MTAVRPDTPIHLQPISANDNYLAIGEGTTSYCPPQGAKMGMCTPAANYTNFAFSGPTSLKMGAFVDGGEYTPHLLIPNSSD